MQPSTLPQNRRILLTGARGQIGTVLTQALRARFGQDAVLATDLAIPQNADGMWAALDVLDTERLNSLVGTFRPTDVYHLAALLSATAEQHPVKAWQVNMQGWLNVLEACRLNGVDRVFFPSTIAVFGPDAPSTQTPQHTALHPTTVYGISKAAGENWAQYYHQRYGLDVRSLRYPGIIGWQSLPGGGTTDYAVDIFHQAVAKAPFTCFLGEDVRLPMMHMDDAVRATLELMDAPAESIHVRTSYNLAGCSFTPAEIADAITQHLPDFTIAYAPDHRDAIARSWPQSIDDSAAARDWGWAPKFNLDALVADMLLHLAPEARIPA